jgi:hypothetical protein
MMIAKFAFLSAAALHPFAPKGSIRGDRAYEPRLPPLLPVESLSPPDGTPPIGSPRSGSPLASSNITRLNAFERGQTPLKTVQTRIPLPPANTAAFVGWLRANKEFGEMTKRRLFSLYAEFCESAFEPVSAGRLMRQLGAQGVVKRRIAPKVINGKYHSPTVYRVLPDGIQRAAA